MDKSPDLSLDEMAEILKAIARDGGNAAARIAAIKELRSMQAGVPAKADSIAKLYEIGKPKTQVQPRNAAVRKVAPKKPRKAAKAA